MLDEHGDTVDEAGPSRPVQVLGLTVGARRRRQASSSSTRTASPGRSPSSVRPASATPQLAKRSRPRLARGPAQALEEGKIEHAQPHPQGRRAPVRSRPSRTRCSRSRSARRSTLRVIDRGVGAITENDVNLAVASDAVIIGFNVRPAEQGRASWPTARASTSGTTRSSTRPSTRSRRRSRACSSRSSRRRSSAPPRSARSSGRRKFGNIAGCLVRSRATIRRNAKARLIRDGAVVADNLTIDSLKRFKDDATEVREGFECGIGLGSFNDIKVDDVIETFEMREKPRA